MAGPNVLQKQCFCFIYFILVTIMTFLILQHYNMVIFDSGLQNVIRKEINNLAILESFEDRRKLLKKTCAKFSDRFRPESAEMDRMPLPATADCWPDCVKNHTKIIIVRHPLERLLSAYRYVFNEKSGFGAIQKNVTFPEFVDLLLNWTTKDSETRDLFNMTVVGVGSHWQPYWHVCSVCAGQLSPHFILKMETIKRDLASYLDKVGLSEYGHKFPHTVPGGQGPTRQYVPEFYSQLTKSQIVELYEYYKMDHELFGYSPEEYIQYGMDDQ